ncbi:MAG TPA: hypothetical protein VFS39_03200 [Nitrospira sp.]|nr:hypothetical protein [Nitrospira sp.]
MTDPQLPWLFTLDNPAETAATLGRGRFCADNLPANRMLGVVQYQHAGLVNYGVRIKVRGRTDVRAKWPIERRLTYRSGQAVMLTIPIEAVRLEAGIFRRSKARWNRWIGRIVLVERREGKLVYTVKLHGENWTLRGHGPVFGATEPSRPWDVVNVVVDPQTVHLAVVDSTDQLCIDAEE